MWTVTNGSSELNYSQGIRLDGPVSPTTVSYENAAYNGADGIAAYQAPSLLIDHCITHDNVQLGGDYEAGIKIEPGTGSTNVIVQYSTSYSNGVGQGDTTGSGIWADTIGNGWTVRYNTVYSNNFIGINIDADNYSLVYGNIAYSNAYAGISAYADGNVSMTGNQIYNNTIWGNSGEGIAMGGPASGATAGGCVNNIVQNNLVIGSTAHSLHAYNGCENPGTNGSGNVYTYNGLGVQNAYFIWWGTAFYSTYTSWEAAPGNCGSTGCSRSIQTDPALVNPPTNFYLQSGSPALASGIYLSGISASNPANVGALGTSINSPTVNPPAP